MIYHFIVILTSGAELLTCYWFITANGILRIALIGLHILLVLVALYALKKIKVSHFLPTENYVSIAFFLSVALPFYGLLGMYLMVFAIGKIQIKKIDYFEYTYKLTPPKYKLLYSDSGLDITGIHSEELDIEAYRDMFTKNDRQMEEVAISKLTKILTRESVAILKEVVKHATSDSKILAATALIEMENKVTKEIDAIRTKLAEKPNDSDIILELARIYDLYCYLDVLDQAVEKYYRALAIEQYRTFLIQHPKHPRATLEYGRTLLNAGEIEKATRVLNSAVTLDRYNPKPYIWLAEAHYAANDYKQVVSICSKIDEFQNLPDSFKPVTGLWSEVA